MKALPKILLGLTGVAALSLAYPAWVQAVPTTYQYTGNPFTQVFGVYTTSDFVTAMVTLAGPLGANMPLTQVNPPSPRSLKVKIEEEPPSTSTAQEMISPLALVAKLVARRFQRAAG